MQMNSQARKCSFDDDTRWTQQKSCTDLAGMAVLYVVMFLVAKQRKVTHLQQIVTEAQGHEACAAANSFGQV
jgi:hypothetical protein